MWEIHRTDEIAGWIKSLDDDAREARLKNLIILQKIGQALCGYHKTEQAQEHE